MEELELVVAEEDKFVNGAKQNKVALLGNFRLSRHWCKEHKSTIASSKTSLQPKNFQYRPWSKRWNLWFWWNMSLNINNKRKIKTNMFCLKVADYPDTNAREKRWLLSWILVYQCCVFDWVSDGGNRISGGSELKVWISSEIKIKSTFWNSWTVRNPMNAWKQKVSQVIRLPQTNGVRWRFRLGESYL